MIIIILFIVGLAWICMMAQKQFDQHKISQLRFIRIQMMRTTSKSEKRRLVTSAEDIAIWLEKKTFLPASKSEAKLLLESIKSYL